MKKIDIYHNPKCSKSRKALEILSSRSDVELNVIEYLRKGLDDQDLVKIFSTLSENQAQDLVRQKEELFKDLSPDISSEESIRILLVKHPELLERPIVISENRSIIARPPEKLEKFFY